MAAAVAMLCSTALAQTRPSAPPPPQLEPLPEPTPPPGAVEPGLEPQVTIIQREAETIEEYRINGRLYMVKVTPRVGLPYYLIDEVGEGRFIRRDGGGTGLRVPMWVISTF